jgi:predicted ArsR family transcriptional regulator
VTLLQSGGLTVDDIASTLELTASAVRAQITAMERDGVVQRAGRRLGTTRPSAVFELTPEVEQLLSRAYAPFLAEVVRVFAEALPPRDIDRLMRQVGVGLADQLPLGVRPSSGLAARVTAASELLNKELGAVTQVEANGKYVIRGVSCPLAAVSGKHPAVCRALASMLSELIGARVDECCDREGRPKCRFEITTNGHGAPRSRRREQLRK